MKKLLCTTLVLTTLLGLTTGTVFAGSVLELLNVQNNDGGSTFTFRVNGEFSRDELKGGFVEVQGGDAFPLYCAQTAPDTVVCRSSKKIGGHDVVVGFNGARFWTAVPEFIVSPSQSQYCYSVWDYWQFTGNYWFNYGPVCQEEPASGGDITKYFVFNAPGGGFDSTVFFYEYNHAQTCGDAIAYDGAAYFNFGCPK